MKLEEEEMIKERRRMKVAMKHLRQKEKVAKKVALGHWSVRNMTADQVKEILGEGDGEGDTGGCSAPALGLERMVERRRTSAVSSTLLRSSTSTTSGCGSSWFGGSNIHHNTSLLSVHSEGEEDCDESVSDGVSLTQSGHTSITIE